MGCLPHCKKCQRELVASIAKFEKKESWQECWRCHKMANCRENTGSLIPKKQLKEPGKVTKKERENDLYDLLAEEIAKQVKEDTLKQILEKYGRPRETICYGTEDQELE